jgi:hypothetical protein
VVTQSDLNLKTEIYMRNDSRPKLINEMLGQAGKESPTRPSTILDPNDPFDAALIPIVETNRRKRKDYAADGDPFSNFKATAGGLGLDGFGPTEAAIFNVLQKLARLQSLRTNGRLHDTANEAVIDTYLDLAVYSIIAYAIALQEQRVTHADQD